MRYLKIFGIYLAACLLMTVGIIHHRLSAEENNKETLNDSSTTGQITICNANTQSPEEVINVNDTQENIMENRIRKSEDTMHRGGYDRYREAHMTAANAEVDTVQTIPVANTNNSEKYVPSGRGKTHTIMGWQLITSKTSKQYKLRSEAGETYDENGFGKIGDRFVVAVKPYYGNVGDYIDVYKSNGEIIHCIIGDIKGSDGGGDAYGHADGSIVEFCVDKYRWYSAYNGLGRYISVSEYYPSWTANSITKIINVGNYWY